MSIQATIIKFFMRFQMRNWSTKPIIEQRIDQEKSVRNLKAATDLHCQPREANGVPVEWVEAPAVGAGVILYLHGGAYALGSINVYRGLVGELSRVTGMRGLTVGYRLAPEHPFPAGLDDAMTVYDWLLEQGIKAKQIIVAGDSAGGGLSLALLVALRDQGKELPTAAVCLSPWTDLTLTSDSMERNKKKDMMLNREVLTPFVRDYVGEHETTEPLISPLFADLTGLPSLFFQVCTDEVLLDDTLRVAQVAEKAGVAVTVEQLDGLFHVFHIISFLPETKAAIERIGAFCRKKLDADERG